MTKGKIRSDIPGALVRPGSNEPDIENLSLEDFLTVRFLVLGRALDRQAKRVYGESFGLTMVQWRIIAMLGEGKIGQVNDLAHNMSYDKALVSRGVADLVEQGYLSRAVNEEDFRSMNLSMTERGHELHRELMAFGRQRQRKLLMALSPAERKSLYSIMNTLRAHLESELEED